MDSRLLLLVLLCSQFRESSQTTSTTAATWAFENQPLDSVLYEDANAVTDLLCVSCNFSPFEVRLDTVSPYCHGCFSIYNTSAPKYCVQYIPFVVTLNHAVTPLYTLRLKCTDDVVGGSKEATADMLVRIRVNQPPTFTAATNPITSTAANVNTASIGDLVYTVTTSDPDGDVVHYTMTTTPTEAASAFEIGATNGEIRTKADLKTVCITGPVSFHVSITDNHNPTQGPQVIHLPLDNVNSPPQCNNCNNVKVQLPEDSPAGTQVFDILKNDLGAFQEFKYYYTFSPTTASTYYSTSVTSKVISTAGTLNYEDFTNRCTNISVVISDGYCVSNPYRIESCITDKNDQPQVTADVPSKTVYEGDITFDPRFRVDDEDLLDTHTYSIVDGNADNAFTIDPRTGKLTAIGYDVDQGAMPTSRTLTIMVEDDNNLGKLNNNVTVTLNILDSNDNPPRFELTSHTYTVTACQAPGLLGALNVTDLDSAYNDNNVWTIDSHTHSYLQVTADGNVYLTNAAPIGTYTLTVTATDRGKVPGPLTSNPAHQITLISTACPTTTVAPTVQPPSAATVPATTISPTGGGTTVVDNLAWIIPLAILAPLLLGLLGFMLWRYCRPYCCGPNGPCAKSRIPTPPPRQVAPVSPSGIKTYEKPRASPAPKRSITPLQPRQPRPPTPQSPSPYMFNFWQETYPDADYTKAPNRRALPGTDTF